MDIIEEKDNHRYQLSHHDPDSITISGVRYNASLLLSPEKLLEHWPVRDSRELQAEHWRTLLSWQPQVVIIGTGRQGQQLPPAILAPLYHANIGVECMSTAAACRTYNALANEGRPVAAALILPA